MDSLTPESTAVQSYLGILQSVIGRMAANSTSCKTWCITLVSAVVVVVADKGRPDYVWIGLIPLALFACLDSYYLGLEKSFRNTYNDFIDKLHAGRAKVGDVFIVAPGGGALGELAAIALAFVSVSVWPFYLLLASMMALVHLLVL